MLVRPSSRCRVHRFAGRKTTLTCTQSSRTRRRWRCRRTRRRCFCSSRTVCCRCRLSVSTVRASRHHTKTNVSFLVLLRFSVSTISQNPRRLHIISTCLCLIDFTALCSPIPGSCIKTHPRSIGAISGACFKVPIMRYGFVCILCPHVV